MSHKQMKKLAVGIVTLLMAGGCQASVSADTSKAIVGGETTLTEDRVVDVLEPAAPRRSYAGIFNESAKSPTVLDMAGHSLTIQSFVKNGGKEEGVAGPIGILGMQGSKIEIYSNKNQPNAPKSTITIHEVAKYSDAAAQGGGQFGAIGIKMGDTWRNKPSTANIDTDVVIEKLLGGTWYARGIEVYGPVTLNIKGIFKVNPGAIGILKPKSRDIFASAIFFSEDGGKINIHTVDIDDSQKNTLRRGIYAANGGGNNSVASILHIGGGVFKVKEDAKGDYYLMDLGKDARVYFNTNEDGTAVGTQTADLQGTICMNGASAYIGLTNNSKWRGGVTGNGSLNLFLADGSEWDTTNGGMGSTISLLNGTGGVIRQKDSGKLTIKNYKGNAYLYYAHEGKGEETADYKAGDTHIEAAEANSTIKIFTDATNIGDATKALNAVVGKLYYAPKDKNLTAQAYIGEGLLTNSIKTVGQNILWKSNGQGMSKDAYAKEKKENNIDIEMSKDYLSRINMEKLNTFGAFSQFTVLTENLSGDNDDEFETDEGIDGYSDIDNYWVKNGCIKRGESSYDINKNTTINSKNGYSISFYKDNQYIDMHNHRLTLNFQSTPGYRDSGILISSNKAVIKNVTDLNIMISGQSKTKHGIFGSEGSLTIENTGTVKFRNTTSKYEEPILLESRDNNSAQLDIKGLVDLESSQGPVVKVKDVNGDVKVNSYVSIGGGIIKAIEDDKVNEDDKGDKANKMKAWAIQVGAPESILQDNEVCSVFINSKDNGKGKVVEQDVKHDVKIEGNVALSYGAKTFGLALNTKDSYFTGLIRVQKGKAHMILKNGAVWNHESKGVLKGVYGSIGNSSLNTFDGDKGFIHQNTSKEIIIDQYSGNTTVVYTHKNQGLEAEDYIGGDIRIGKFKKGSVITVLTSNENIDNYSKRIRTILKKKIQVEGDLGIEVKASEGLLTAPRNFFTLFIDRSALQEDSTEDPNIPDFKLSLEGASITIGRSALTDAKVDCNLYFGAEKANLQKYPEQK
ncbi:hypothetical protein HMPREF3191_00672, partial [Veillonellaceae bacterium DNF00626]